MTQTTAKQPRALYMLFFAEMWERFSFYGMRALLVLYMVNQMHYADKKANLIYGAYMALVYIMPLFGGMLADKLLGARRSIILGGILMSVGHFVLAIPTEGFFFYGLGFIIAGNCFFKPNISSLVGKLYEPGDTRRDAGFSLFYMGINIGAFAGGLLCGYLGQEISWHLGFGVAGVLMLIGLAVFQYWQKILGDKGLAPDEAKISKPIFAFFNVKTLIYSSAILLIPIYVFLIKQNDIFDKIIWPIAGAALIYLLYLAHSHGKSKGLKLLAAIILIMSSIVFWAFYEQGGGSLNLYADRNVNMVMKPLGPIYHPLKDIAKGDTIIFLDQVEKLSKGTHITIERPGLLEASQLTIDSISTSNHLIELSKPVKYAWPMAVKPQVKSVSELSSASMNNAINPFFIILLSPIFAGLWLWSSKRKWEPNSPVKFGLAFLQLGLGFYIFKLGGVYAGASGLVPLFFFCAGYFILSTAELCISPIGLSMVTKLAPAENVGQIMGAWFLASGLGQYLAGQVGAMMAIPNVKGTVSLPPIQSLAIYSGIFVQIAIVSIFTGLLILLLSPILRKWMQEVR
jgi:POT family proton-dependent oligopeptide transporter